MKLHKRRRGSYAAQLSTQRVPRSTKHGKEHHLLSVRLVPTLARRSLHVVVQKGSRNVLAGVEPLFTDTPQASKPVEPVCTALGDSHSFRNFAHLHGSWFHIFKNNPTEVFSNDDEEVKLLNFQHKIVPGPSTSGKNYHLLHARLALNLTKRNLLAVKRTFSFSFICSCRTTFRQDVHSWENCGTYMVPELSQLLRVSMGSGSTSARTLMNSF